MSRMICYLNFDGNCREAMQFYTKSLSADLGMTTYGEAKCGGPPEADALLVHSQLTKGTMVLMGSDVLPGMPFRAGNNFCVCVDCDSREDLEAFFAAIGEGGKVDTELQQMFWGDYFGTLTDRFGVRWMFNFKPASVL